MPTLPSLEQRSGVHALLDRKLEACDDFDRVVAALRDGRTPAAPAAPLELFVALGGRPFNLARLDPLLGTAATLDVRLVDGICPAPEVAGLAGRAAAAGVFVTLFPGRAVPEAEAVRALVVAGLGRVAVEFAGATAAAHDAAQGAGAWADAFRLLETLHEERLAAGVRWPEPVAHLEARFGDLAQLPGFVVKLAGAGVTRLVLRIAELGALRPLELMVVAECRDLAACVGLTLDHDEPPAAEDGAVCVHRFSSLAVDPYGVVYPCAQGALRAVEEYAVGAIESDDPLDLWRGEALADGRRRAAAHEIPPGCAWCLRHGRGRRHDEGHPSAGLREAIHAACQNLAIDAARRGGAP